MNLYPRLKEGAILRARINCRYTADANYVAVSPTGATYLLDEEHYKIFTQCDGTTPTHQIIGLREKVAENGDILEVITFEKSTSPISAKQRVEVSNLITPCRQVIWHSTRNCNMKCKHCYYLYADEEKKSFTIDKIYTIATNLHTLGVEIVRISGGEASLEHDKFIAIIDALSQQCIPTIVSTNGWKNQEHIINAVKKNPYMRAVHISLDGPKVAHNYMRRTNSFDEIKKNISQYLANGINIRVTSMLFDAWLDKENMADMCNHIAEMGVNDWIIEIPSDTGLWKCNTSQATNRIFEAATTVYKFLETVPHNISSFSFNQVFDWPNPKESILKNLDDPICSHDLGLLSFGPEGISFCTLFREKFGNNWKDMGRMEENNFKDVWNKIAQKRISTAIRDNVACTNCQLFYVCQGGCPGQYSNAPYFNGCDVHSRNLAIVRKRFFASRGWSL